MSDPIQILRTALVGICVEVGDDDDYEGQPRLIIHTTREEIKRFPDNFLYGEVEVKCRVPVAENTPSEVPQALRVALVALLADLLRDSQKNAAHYWATEDAGVGRHWAAREDERALRRVMEIVRRGGERGKEGAE